jgi:hypothetical protein
MIAAACDDPEYASGCNNPEAADFEIAVEDLMRNIARNPVAEILLDALNRRPALMRATASPDFGIAVYRVVS